MINLQIVRFPWNEATLWQCRVILHKRNSRSLMGVNSQHVFTKTLISPLPDKLQTWALDMSAAWSCTCCPPSLVCPTTISSCTLVKLSTCYPLTIITRLRRSNMSDTMTSIILNVVKLLKTKNTFLQTVKKICLMDQQCNVCVVCVFLSAAEEFRWHQYWRCQPYLCHWWYILNYALILPCYIALW